MIRLRSTVNCTNTPRVRFALEEMAVAYEVETVPDGTFLRTFGIPGPEFLDDGYSVVEIGAIVRHVCRRFGHGTMWPAELSGQADADRWLDFLAIRLSRAAANRDLAALSQLLGVLDRHLSSRDWMLGNTFTVADCGVVPMLQKRKTYPLEQFPALSTYLDRVAARPAWTRAQARTPH